MSTPNLDKSDDSALEARTAFAGDAAGEQTLGRYWRGYLDKVKSGDIGSLPAVFGLLVLVIIFTVARPDTFFSIGNFANLWTQGGSILILAMGVSFVLLLGHIDLAAGVSGAVGAAAMAKLMVAQEWSWLPAVAVALLVGVAIGLLTGFLVTKVGIPSFVVTLAFFLSWQGVLLLFTGAGGTIRVSDPVILAIANGRVPVLAGWIAVIACLVLYAGISLMTWRSRQAQKLVNPPIQIVFLRIAAVSIVVVLATWALSLNRALRPPAVLEGIPWVVPLIAVLFVVWTFVQNRTAFGRYIYAVGGNKEAARRAGIRVASITIACFVITATMAVISAFVAASRSNGVTPDAGGGNTLLYAVAAAVIGGTSLFGGKGRALDAVIGGLVIAVIDNGLGLLGLEASVKMIITGGVLLLAASVDALTRQRRAGAGR